MTERKYSRSFYMPTKDPDKEDEHVEYNTETFKAPKSKCSVSGAIYHSDGRHEKISEAFNKCRINQEAFGKANILNSKCPAIQDDGCNHRWKKYTGLSEQFSYCEKCDEKKD